jgi:carbonic anhydrase/acetyltransferase-like protein (isoleucine patch superfamily)
MIYNLGAKIYSYEGKTPEFKGTVYLMDGAKLTGDITFGDACSVWFNTVIRGDVHFIKIGKRVNIQDMSMLHVTNGKFPLNIEDNVTIAHSVNLHGSTVRKGAMIGIGATVLDGSIIGENSLVAAGALVREGYEVPPFTLVAGVPAKPIRKLKDEEIKRISDIGSHYINYAKKYFNL